MTLADVIILSLIAIAIILSIVKIIKNREKHSCAGCDSSQPKWIQDYKRKIK